MRFRLARKYLVTRGIALALASMVAGSAVDWGHNGTDDPQCAPALVIHNQAAHRFAAATTPSSAEHCFICHSLRLLHGALTAAVGQPAVDQVATAGRAAGCLLARNLDAHTLASRAPPVVSL